MPFISISRRGWCEEHSLIAFGLLASSVAQRDSGQRLPGSEDVTGQQLTGSHE